MIFVANLPHLKCYIRKEYLHDLNKGHGEFVDAVMLAVKSIQGRALMFEAYLPEYGACFDKFPLSAFVWKKDIKEEEQLPLGTIELWDCFSNNIQIWTKNLLKSCDVDIMLRGGERMGGQYLFTIDSCHGDPQTIDTGVSEVPEEHKQFNFGKLDNGQYFAQPNNRMLWYEQSLTSKELKIPDFQVSSRYFHCEQERKWAFGDTNDYFYKEKERTESEKLQEELEPIT
tara:strand:- start:35448 stop:36131 length:684 start_codon:yes stop_codon:yes gene_type:complete